MKELSPEWLDELDLAEAALAGDPAAVGRIVAMVQSPTITAALCNRGASPAEARDIAGDLMGDCFGGEKAKGGTHRLLGRYNGACPLVDFLKHVALNRLISLKRRQAARKESELDENRRHEDAPPSSGDLALVSLLADALHRAFQQVDPDDFVAFRLVHFHQVSQKSVASAWGWSESMISRRMAAMGSQLRSAVIDELRAADPWLEVGWEDFRSLCRESVDLFSAKKSRSLPVT